MLVACVNGIKKVVLCLCFFGLLVIKEVQSLKSGLLLFFHYLPPYIGLVHFKEGYVKHVYHAHQITRSPL